MTVGFAKNSIRTWQSHVGVLTTLRCGVGNQPCSNKLASAWGCDLNPQGPRAAFGISGIMFLSSVAALKPSF